MFTCLPLMGDFNLVFIWKRKKKKLFQPSYQSFSSLNERIVKRLWKGFLLMKSLGVTMPGIAESLPWHLLTIQSMCFDCFGWEWELQLMNHTVSFIHSASQLIESIHKCSLIVRHTHTHLHTNASAPSMPAHAHSAPTTLVPEGQPLPVQPAHNLLMHLQGQYV